MGKKKIKDVKELPGDTASKSGNQQHKTYAYSRAQKQDKAQEEDSIYKVQIPADKEETLLELIQSSRERNSLKGKASDRLTNKKLVDLYNCLQATGFKHAQIEQAMSHTVLYGGDLLDTLDWFCIYTPNDQLPEGFSQTMEEEEEKVRQKFDMSMQVEAAAAPVVRPGRSETESKKVAEKRDTEQEKEKGLKDWILRYSERSSDEEEEGSDPENLASDPNETYLELVAKLEDLKLQASEAKAKGNKAENKKFSQEIRALVNELAKIEAHPSFDARMKIADVGEDQKNNSEKPAKIPEKAEFKKEETEPLGADGALQLDGLSMFEEMAATEEKKPVKPKDQKPLDKRCFEYTRKQWTGKSPKQFLIDWIRKNLAKSPPPSYHKVSVRGNVWRARCKVVRPKEGDLEVTPEIVCENLKEAEHLASTLALYHLCKGQSVHNLLPPGYRDVWLEWKEADNKLRDEKREQVNKPRDQFVAKLLKKIKAPEIQDDGSSGATGNDVISEIENEASSGNDVEESWEDVADEETSTPEANQKKQQSKAQSRSKSARVFAPEELKAILITNQKSAKYSSLLETRQQLPVYQYREQIVSAISRENVVVIAGETGSGKSTQIPQFLVQDLVLSENGGQIVCTEPRRISTISLANRVSEEMGESSGPGNPRSLVGYQIRFESRRCATTRLSYCTTGVLLRQLQQDPLLKGVSCVVVDEVHERSVQSDFLLTIMRDLLKRRRDLKIVLMSATVDADKFSAYFQHCPVIHVPGRTFPVQVFHIEDVIEQTAYKLEEDSPYCRRFEDVLNEESASVSVTSKGGDSHKVTVSWTKDDLHTIDKSGLSPSDYTIATRNVVTRTHPDRINMELIIELLHLFEKSPAYRDVEGAVLIFMPGFSHIQELYDLIRTHFAELLHLFEKSPAYRDVEGAVLIFMPGFSHIQDLYDLIRTDKRFSKRDKYRVIPLHSVLSTGDQNQAFSTPPPGVRKIVIATNVAETGITIPDVVFVIDSGKVKENRYMETSGMSALEEVWVSKASAKQRLGRGGRVREGFCFRIYTKHMYQALRDFSVPEILRVPLEELCLHIMKCELGDPASLLSQCLDPPQSVAVSRAMAILRGVGAVQREESGTGNTTSGGEYLLTPLGHHLAALPVNVRVGKMLVYGAMLGCLYPVCVIGASMTDKSPFVLPLGKKDQVQAAKQALAIGQSDHLTLLRAFLGWQEAEKKGYEAGMQFCNQYFLKRSSLMDIQNVSNDLRKLVQSIGFDTIDAVSILKKSKATKKLVSASGVLNISQSEGPNTLSADLLSPGMLSLLKAVLTAGLYPNVAKTSFEAKVDAAANPEPHVCRGETPQGPVAVHPGSVNRSLALNGLLIYQEKVRSTRIYVRETTVVKPYSLLLFGGDIFVQHNAKTVLLDDWIQFKAFAKTGVIFKELRVILDDVLRRKIHNPKLNLKDEPLIPVLLELIATER